MICSHNNNSPINIPSHPYVLLNRSILCNCDIEAESNFLLESLAACEEKPRLKPNLEMYFTMNLAFVDYFGKTLENLEVPVLRDWTTQKQILPISLEKFEFSPKLLNVTKTLRDLVTQYNNKRQIQDTCGQILVEKDKRKSKFGTFLQSFLVDVLVFTVAGVTVIISLIIIYMLCGQSKMKTLVTNLALQHLKSVDATDSTVRYCTCEPNWYIVGLLMLMLLGITYMVLNKIKREFEGRLFSNVTKVMLFLSDNRSYVSVKLSRIAGSIHLFRITGRLTMEVVKFKRNWIWDILEIDWKNVNMTLNGNNKNLPSSVVIPLRENSE